MATIRHMAVYSDNPEKLAEFYRDVFDFRIINVVEGGHTFITDGYMHIAVLTRSRLDSPVGINHFGISVDESEKDEIYAKMRDLGLEPESDPSFADRPYVEDKAFDVDGNQFDLATGLRALE